MADGCDVDADQFNVRGFLTTDTSAGPGNRRQSPVGNRILAFDADPETAMIHPHLRGLDIPQSSRFASAVARQISRAPASIIRSPSSGMDSKGIDSLSRSARRRPAASTRRVSCRVKAKRFVTTLRSRRSFCESCTYCHAGLG